jgi:hypothetical protein
MATRDGTACTCQANHDLFGVAIQVVRDLAERPALTTEDRLETYWSETQLGSSLSPFTLQLVSSNR